MQEGELETRGKGDWEKWRLGDWEKGENCTQYAVGSMQKTECRKENWGIGETETRGKGD
jgi:hypothetical protein